MTRRTRKKREPRWRKRRPNRSSSSEGRRTRKTGTRSSLGGKIVVGLGNPGPKYERTRHNVGFEVVDRLSGSRHWESARHFDHAGITIRSRPVALIKPTTFMNDSGLAVDEALNRFGSSLGDILVLVDDIHLDVGRMRVRRSGSEGGHNGLRSIVDVVRSEAFARVRLGIGEVPPGEDQIRYVLSRFGTQELQQVERMYYRAAEAVRTWCGAGVDVAMNAFNRR